MSRRILKNYSSVSPPPAKKQKLDNDKKEKRFLFNLEYQFKVNDLNTFISNKVLKEDGLFEKISNAKYEDLDSIIEYIIKEYLLCDDEIKKIKPTTDNLGDLISSGKTLNHIYFLLSILYIISHKDFKINEDNKFVLEAILQQIEESAYTAIYAKEFIKKRSGYSKSYIYLYNLNEIFELQNKYLNEILNKYEYLSIENNMNLFIDNNDQTVIKNLTTRNYSAFTANTIILFLIQKLQT